MVFVRGGAESQVKYDLASPLTNSVSVNALHLQT